MKTLTASMIALAFAAATGSAALANDGPHNRDTTSVAYMNSVTYQQAGAGTQSLDAQSQATLDLNLRGDAASTRH